MVVNIQSEWPKQSRAIDYLLVACTSNENLEHLPASGCVRFTRNTADSFVPRPLS